MSSAFTRIVKATKNLIPEATAVAGEAKAATSAAKKVKPPKVKPPKGKSRKTAKEFVKEATEAPSETLQQRARRRYREQTGKDPETDNYYSKKGEPEADSHPGYDGQSLFGGHLKGSMRRGRTNLDEHDAKTLGAYYRLDKGAKGAELPRHLVDALKSGNPERFIAAYEAAQPKMQTFIDKTLGRHMAKLRNAMMSKDPKSNPRVRDIMKEMGYMIGIGAIAGAGATKAMKSSSEEA